MGAIWRIRLNDPCSTIAIADVPIDHALSLEMLSQLVVCVHFCRRFKKFIEYIQNQCTDKVNSFQWIQTTCSAVHMYFLVAPFDVMCRTSQKSMVTIRSPCIVQQHGILYEVKKNQ